MNVESEEQALKQILDGVWHSRSVNDVIPEIMALLATEYQHGKADGSREELGAILLEMYRLYDGNTGEGLWEFYDKWHARLAALGREDK